MKRNSWLALSFAFVASCGIEKDFRPESHLSIQEQDKVVMRIIRYVGKAPENVSSTEKLHKKYDYYYQELASRHRLEKYFIDAESTHYFLISRAAPSLFEKMVATGGKLKFSKTGQLLEYEEVFRTWKMLPDTLAKRSLFLFKKMVNDEDLSPYYASSSGNTDFIEFPDDRTYFDKKLRMWRVK